MLRVDKDPDVVVGGVQGPVFTKVKSWISVGGLETQCMYKQTQCRHTDTYTRRHRQTHIDTDTGRHKHRHRQTETHTHKYGQTHLSMLVKSVCE